MRIGRIEPWIVQLKDPDDRPVYPAQIGVNGGMPGHGHGLPTRPVVTEYLGEGRYRVEGIELSMAGEWVLLFEVRAGTRMDRIQFEIDVAPTPDSRWTGDESDVLASLLLTEAPPPPSPSNRVADDPRAAALGERLFFDRSLSGNGELSCASCHDPERHFTDGRARGQGLQDGLRNTPTVVGAAHGSWFYWDGRRDSLWSQALIPFEAAGEMGSSRVAVVRRILQEPTYMQSYAGLFGASGVDAWIDELPAHAGPFGEPPVRNAWFQIAKERQEAINRVYSNLGKCIEAYERTLRPEPSRFDAYVQSVLHDPESANQLSSDERRGLALFIADESRCMRCHNGPLFTNGGFHNIGTGQLTGQDLDFGRVFGLQAAFMDEFNCLGSYSDAKSEDCKALRFANRNDDAHMRGAFKVPSLRGVARTAPYFHDGRHATLEDVVRFYNSPGPKFDGLELEPLGLDDDEIRALVSFLKTL